MTSSPYDNSVQAGQVVELLLAKRAIRFHTIPRAGVRATVARVGDIGLSRACTPAEFAGRTKKCGPATVPLVTHNMRCGSLATTVFELRRFADGARP
jgi:hypothetical protein